MIVNDHQLKVVVGLTQNRFDGPADVLFTIISGKANRDKRLPGTGHGLSTLSLGLKSFRLSAKPIFSEMI